jgi:multiple sugar transport system substrate-binding protein
MNKRNFAKITALLLGLICLAGCGKTTDDNSIKVIFWHTSGVGLTRGFEDAAKKFTALVKINENVDVTVSVAYQGGYSDIESKISKGFATGAVPTLAIAYPDHVADYLASDVNSKGYVRDLSSYIDDPTIGFGKESWLGDGSKDDFVPAFYQEGTKYSKTGVYSLPFMKSTEALFYNYDLLVPYAKNYTPDGYSAPLGTPTAIKAFMEQLTWPQLIDLATYIKAQPSAASLLAPIFYDADENLFISQSYQRNIPYLSIKEDGKCSVDFNNNDAKAMVTELKKAYDAGLIVTKGTQNEYSSQSFVGEKCVFSIASTGGTGYQDPGAQFQAEAVKVPYSNSNPLYVSQGPTLTILNNPGLSTEKNDLATKYAFKFVKYLTSAAVNTTLCINDSEGYIPVRKSAYETDAWKKNIEENADLLTTKAAVTVVNEVNDKYLWSPAVKGSAKARTEVGGIITNVFMGKKTVDDAFASAYQQASLAI